MDWNDWQFWIVTIAALASVAWLLRPRRAALRRKAEACRTCACRVAEFDRNAADLTIAGRRV